MKSFDDFLNQQLEEAGVADALKRAGKSFANGVKQGAKAAAAAAAADEQATNKVTGPVMGALGKKKDEFLARLGSNAAKGRLDLRDMEKMLRNDYAVYCATQRISVRTSCVEDFLEFLKHKVGFDFPDAVFDKLAYGVAAKGEGQHKDDIRRLYDDIAQGLETKSDVSQPIQQMAQFASAGGPDSVAARKALWGLARENPSQISAFKSVTKWVGKPLGDSFPTLVTSIASLILKTANSKMTPEKGDKKSTGRPEHDVKAESLDVGPVPLFPSREMRDPLHCQAFIEELARFGMAKNDLTKYLDASTSWGEEEAKKGAKMLDRKFKLDATINVCRILLQTLRGKTGPLSNIFQWFKDGGDADAGNLENKLRQMLGQSQSMKDGNGNDQLVYDATAFNEAIHSKIRQERPAADMLTVIIHELRKAGAL